MATDDAATLETTGPGRGGAGGGPRRRLVGVDAARGLALLGMMVVHVLPASDSVTGETTTPYLLAGGRSAAAFAVLAGVGLALATGAQRPHTGARRSGDRVAILVRAAAIGLIGLLLGYADSGVAVILAYYALFFVLALPFLWLRPLYAGAAALAVAVVVPVASALLRPELPPKDIGNPTLDTLLAMPGHLLATLSLTGYYPALAWTAYLCAGIAVGRLPLASARVAGTLLCGGAALALTAAAGSAFLLGPAGGLDVLAASSRRDPSVLAELLERSKFGTLPTDTWWWLAVDSPHSTTTFDLLETTGTAVALVGAMLLLARLVPWLLSPLAAAGSMTLSLYTAHVLLLSTEWLPEDPKRSWLLQAVAALGLAWLWRRLVGRGPLELLIAVVADRARAAVAADG